MNYYNEIDPYCVEWLKTLIHEGLIAPGDVDERDIRDVTPAELVGYAQCHFFAGLGGWSYALRLAGWPDDRPVWTGSCPCQPFSQAGRGGGFADERHLWPYWFHHISVLKPSVVFGEQVASPDGLRWFDLVSTDLEAAGYAVGSADLCAAGVGAPHLRQRLWFVADSDRAGCERRATDTKPKKGDGSGKPGDSKVDFLGHASPAGPSLCEPENLPGERWWEKGGAVEQSGSTSLSLANPQVIRSGTGLCDSGSGEKRGNEFADDGGNFWSDLTWLYCRDGKWRSTKPGLFPLAHGVPARVGRLRAAGNAIVPEVAAEFIRVYLAGN